MPRSTGPTRIHTGSDSTALAPIEGHAQLAAYQRAPTLMAGASGVGTGVRVWSPNPWRHWLAFGGPAVGSISLLLLRLGGLLHEWRCPWVLLLVGATVLSVIVSLVREFRRLSYITTDDHGMAVTTRKGTSALSWTEIRSAALGAGDLGWLAGGLHYPRLYLKAGDAIEVNLSGYSPDLQKKLVRLIADRAGLDPREGTSNAFVHPEDVPKKQILAPLALPPGCSLEQMAHHWEAQAALNIACSDQYDLAHRNSARHRDLVLESDWCGCFFCLARFRPNEVEKWLEGGATARCPRCGVDSVLPSWAGWPVEEEFLEAMHDRWFEGIRSNPEQFVARCWRGDGSYRPSPDSVYAGRSDTALSDLAAVTYAAVLSRTFGWDMAAPDRSVAYVRERQRPDGSFAHLGGEMDPESDLAILYNTTQAVVALAALDSRPVHAPHGVMERFFRDGAYRSLPWYTTSFFPLFYRALGDPFPEAQRQALQEHMEANQAEDGYLGGHVAATFHMAHFYRLIGEPTPRAEAMVRRTLRDQTPDGGWNFKDPDWDVHACFDAVFILRQLGNGTEEVENAIARAADWAERCQNADGGFGHYPGWHSDMDAVYFQLGALAMANRLPVQPDLPHPEILGWGHAMPPPGG